MSFCVKHQSWLCPCQGNTRSFGYKSPDEIKVTVVTVAPTKERLTPDQEVHVREIVREMLSDYSWGTHGTRG
jgi:hypothetical protein